MEGPNGLENAFSVVLSQFNRANVLSHNPSSLSMSNLTWTIRRKVEYTKIDVRSTTED